MDFCAKHDRNFKSNFFLPKKIWRRRMWKKSEQSDKWTREFSINPMVNFEDARWFRQKKAANERSPTSPHFLHLKSIRNKRRESSKVKITSFLLSRFNSQPLSDARILLRQRKSSESEALLIEISRTKRLFVKGSDGLLKFLVAKFL